MQNSSHKVVQADREKAAGLVSQWVEGAIDLWDFEDQWPEESEDRAVRDIGRGLWTFYSDYPNKLLTISELTNDRAEVLRKCLMFLKSGEPYEPVPYEEVVPWKPNFFTWLFRVKERPWETMRLKLNPERAEWWPFVDEAQFRRAMKVE